MKKILASSLVLFAATLAACNCDCFTPKKSQPVSAAPASAFTDTIPSSQIKFEMILIPGDPAKEIKPFYLGKCEVTWDEFMIWAICKDLPENTHDKERDLKQRPSKPAWPVDRQMGFANRPALSMSRRSAELYCQWLSKQTGKKYRLPTEKEWLHAFTLGVGGGVDKPLSAQDANRLAVWKDNALKNDSGIPMSSPVGSKSPDKLGLHDMAGNVAEWVTDTGKDHIIRGGYFESDLAHLGALGREIEDEKIWNANDPGDPKSPWWFYDHVGVGMRLVCEP
jgi:formylglycine-generating enzyme required for sulfatase activity